MPLAVDTRHPASGMTLAELLVVLAILAISVTSIGPSLFGAMDDSRIAGYADSLKMDMKLARQEAILRGYRVIICPIAANDTSGCVNDASWRNGWMVFADADESGSPTTPEQDLIRVQDPIAPSVEILSHFGLIQRRIIYTPNGASQINGNFEIKSTNAHVNARTRILRWSALRDPTISYQ